MYTVSSLFCQQAGRIADEHWKYSYKAVKNCIFKNINKAYSGVYAVNSKKYTVFYRDS